MKKILFILACLISFGARATTFCHVETGQCLDPQVNDTIGHYLARYTAQATAGWNVVACPDGTPHNSAAVQVAGVWSFTPPSVPSHSVAATLTKAEFQRYSYAQLGAIAQPSGTAAQQLAAGIARYGQVIMALKASSDPATAAAYDAYLNNNTFELDWVMNFVGIIGPTPGSGIITAAERDAVVGNWP